MENFWNLVEEKKPNSYKTGHWDGRMSDDILFSDKDGLCFVGTCYQGILDGSEYCCFYDKNDFDIPNITHWANIPELF